MAKVRKKKMKGKGKGVNNSTRFDRELKKLEWTVKDKRGYRLILERKGFIEKKSFVMIGLKILDLNC